MTNLKLLSSGNITLLVKSNKNKNTNTKHKCNASQRFKLLCTLRFRVMYNVQCPLYMYVERKYTMHFTHYSVDTCQPCCQMTKRIHCCVWKFSSLQFDTFDPLPTAICWHFLQENLIFYSKISETPLICTGEEEQD